MDAIFGERFYAGRGKGAWHHKGTVDDVQRSAADAYAMVGTYGVYKLPLQTIAKRQDGTHIQVPAFGLIRGPVADDPKEAYFGTVSADYRLVTPEEIVNLWDERVRKPVETLMALKDGKQFVITAKLDAFNVRGDEIENYLMLFNFMDGGTAAGANTSSVRVVCANTFAASLGASTDNVRFIHDQWVLNRLGRWMEDTVQRAEAKLPRLQEQYDVMAAYALTKNRPEAPREIKHVITTAYPQLPEYVVDPILSDEVNEERAKRRQSERRVVDERRIQAFELFKGAGTGMRNQATWGTMFGLYQSVVELEDYKGGSKGANLAHSILFGERAETKSRAFDAAMAVIGGTANI